MGKDLCTRYQNRNEKESAQNVALRDWSRCSLKTTSEDRDYQEVSNRSRWREERQEPWRTPRGLNERTD